MIRDAARDFTQSELLPGVIERDDKQEFPARQIKQLGELGFMGMMVSPEYGGSGMDTLSYVLAMEEFSKVDASASVVVSVNNSLVCWDNCDEPVKSPTTTEYWNTSISSVERCFTYTANTLFSPIFRRILGDP